MNKIMVTKKLMMMVRASLIHLQSQVLRRLVDVVDVKCVKVRFRKTPIPLENSPQIASDIRIMEEDGVEDAEVVVVGAVAAKMVKQTITTKTTTIVVEEVETEEAIIAEAEEATMIIEADVEDITTVKVVEVATKIGKAVEVVGMTAGVVAAIMIAAAEAVTSKATIIEEVAAAEAAVFSLVQQATLLLMQNVMSRQSRKEINSVTSRVRCEDW